MSVRGIITLVGIAAFTGLAGMLVLDEYLGPPYRTPIEQIRKVKL